MVAHKTLAGMTGFFSRFFIQMQGFFTHENKAYVMNHD